MPVVEPRSLEASQTSTLDQGRPVAGDRLYRLSVERYQRMARDGIQTKDDRVELIEGLLVWKMTKHERHVATTKLILRACERCLPDGWHVAKEDPIVTARSEPGPDIAILRGTIEDGFHRIPSGGDITLVVEVAEPSYKHDRHKRAISAEAGIPSYWIANLNADRIEACSDPTGPDPSPDYRTRRDCFSDESIPLIIEGREVARLAVAESLAPPASRGGRTRTGSRASDDPSPCPRGGT